MDVIQSDRDLVFIRNIALPTTLLLSALFGLATWLNVEIFLSILFGVILIANPEYLLATQMKGEVDNYHMFLCCLLGALLIYNALFPFMMYHSRDDSVLNGHFWSRIISCSFIFISMLIAYRDGMRWDYNLIFVYGGPLLISFFVNIYFLITSENTQALDHHKSPANTIANIDFLLTLIIGLVLFGFPRESMIDVRMPNDGHELLCRCCGVLIFSMSLESLNMSSFLFYTDKRNFLFLKFLGNVLIFVVVWLGYYYYQVIHSYNMAILYSLFILAYNSLIAYGFMSCKRRLIQTETLIQTITGIMQTK